MFRTQWEGKLAINKHGDLPTECYLSFVKIIYELPHSLIFNPHMTAQEIYPRSRRRTKNDPRPMNSFMILTRVVRIVASGREVDLGDGQSCTKICQLIRWGADKKEWQIFLNLQEEFKKIHSSVFPKYDYRPKKNAVPPNINDFIIMNSDNYDKLTQSQHRKKSTHKEKQNRLPKALPPYPTIRNFSPSSSSSPSPSPSSSPSPSPSTISISNSASTWNKSSSVTYEACESMPHDKMTSNTISMISSFHAETPSNHHSRFSWEPSIAVNCNH